MKHFFVLILGMLAVSLPLFNGTVAKADTIYQYASNIQVASTGYSWAFEVPSILTSTYTTSTFLSTNGFGSAFGSCTITSVTIANPLTSPVVNTNFSGCVALPVFIQNWTPSTFGSDGSYFHQGAFNADTLTISSTVPEPGTLLLLASGLIGTLATLRWGRRTSLRTRC
jgi:hypothetical protein